MFISRSRQVKRRSKYSIEPQEIFLDQLAQKKQDELGISEKKLERPLSQRVLLGLWLCFFAAICLLLVKTFHLQVFEKEQLEARAQENKFIVQSIEATRGVIYDKEGEQLVFNKPSFNLLCPEGLPQKAVQILGLDSAQNLSHQKLILLEANIDELEGCRIQRKPSRDYKGADVFSHILGYTAKINKQELKDLEGDYSINDLVGRAGLEKFYEETLARIPGKVRLEQDVFGNLKSKEIVSLPAPGKSLELFLDAQLQQKLYQELKQGVNLAGSRAGAAVALDAKTGGVLSLVSFPGFDSNLFGQGTEAEALEALLNDAQEPLFNRAISGQYAPGSTIKPLVGAAALQEQIITPDKSINCQGLIEVEHRYDPDIVYKFPDWAVHGWTDLRKAIAVSCNIYFYMVGGGYKKQQGLGPTKIKQYLELFGWGRPTGIDLPGEKPGLLPDKEWKQKNKKENWWDGDTYHLAIGQGDILVTPLQVAAAFAAVANGGTVYRPQIVKDRPEIIRENFISPENLQIIREGMRQSVTYGSANNYLNSLPVAVAAKTGTAQTPRQGYFHNWVTVFAPYLAAGQVADEPQIVLTVMIENVKGMQAAVLPVARNVLRWYFTQ